MRWKSPRGKYDNIEDWHDWFAWHPVRLCTIVTRRSLNKKAWLETVRRAGTMRWDVLSRKTYWTYEYHAKDRA